MQSSGRLPILLALTIFAPPLLGQSLCLWCRSFAVDGSVMAVEGSIVAVDGSVVAGPLQSLVLCILDGCHSLL